MVALKISATTESMRAVAGSSLRLETLLVPEDGLSAGLDEDLSTRPGGGKIIAL